MIALLALAGMFDALRAADQRVATVAWHLQTANAGLCAQTAPLAGFSIDTLDQYAVADRAEAMARFGLGDLPQVSAVVPGSAADKAGLRPGDVIVAVDGRPVPRRAAGKPDYRQAADVEAALVAALAQPPATLTLAERNVSFAGDRGCASLVQLVPGPRSDASADGRYVQITSALYGLAENDAELAFIIAHELAHNAVPEAARASRAGAQRLAELAADRAAIAMMARAGYDVGAVPPFLERLGQNAPRSWRDGSHPGWPARLAAATRVIEELGRTGG